MANRPEGSRRKRLRPNPLVLGGRLEQWFGAGRAVGVSCRGAADTAVYNLHGV